MTPIEGGLDAEAGEPSELQLGVQLHDLVPEDQGRAVGEGAAEEVEHGPTAPSEGRSHACHGAGLTTCPPAQVAHLSIEVVASDHRSAGTAHARGPQAVSLVGERGDRHAPPTADRADDVLSRDPRIGEEHLVEGRATGHLLQRAYLDALLVHVDDEVGDAAVLRDARVGAGDEDPPTAVLSARGPHLLTIDDPLLTVLHGTGLDARQVRARSGLGEQLAPHVAPRDHVGQEASFLILGAVVDDRRSGHHHADATRRPDGSDLTAGTAHQAGLRRAEPLPEPVDRPPGQAPT